MGSEWPKAGKSKERYGQDLGKPYCLNSWMSDSLHTGVGI